MKAILDGSSTNKKRDWNLVQSTPQQKTTPTVTQKRDWSTIINPTDKPLQSNNSGRDWNSINKATGIEIKKVETKPAETKKPNKLVNFFANIGKKAVDTYETTANKDRIGLLGSNKIFSVKDAQNYTNGPKGENPIFNAMAKPSRTALYTLLAPMRSKIFNRAISQADNTMTMNENTSKKIESGSKIGNAIADIGGTVLGYAVNPAGVDGSLLNLSQGLSKPIAKTISKKVLSKTTNKVANKILPALGREFVEGSSLSVANDLVNKKDTKTIIKNAAIQGGVGALLGGSIEGLGLLKNSALKTSLTESKLGLKSPKGKVFQNAENVKLKDYYNNLEYQDYINSLDPAYVKAENVLRTEKGLPPLNKLNAKLTLKKERVLSPVLETGQAPKLILKKEKVSALETGITPKPLKNTTNQFSKTFTSNTQYKNLPVYKSLSNAERNTLEGINKAGVSIDDMINDTKNSIKQIEDNHFNYLKTSGGQGTIRDTMPIRNDQGNIISSYQSISSNNPGWYQDFYKSQGRKPTQLEMKGMIQGQLKNGFNDFGTVPPNETYSNLQKQLQMYEGLKNKLNTGYKEGLQVSNKPILKNTEVFKGTVEQPKQVVKPMFNNTVVGSTEWVTPKLEPTLQPKTAVVKPPKLELTLKPKLEAAPKTISDIPLGEATWKNKNYDQPVKVIGDMGTINGKRYVKIEGSNTGIPLDEIKYSQPNTTTIPNTLGTITSKLDKKTDKHIIAKGYTELIDNLDPINRVSPTAYEKALNTRQNDMIAHRILTNKLVDTKGNVIGDSLKDITKDMPIAQKTEFADYLKARHAPSWIDQGRKVYPDELGMTSDMAKQKALNYEILHPEFKAQADKLVKFQQDLTKSWLVDTGIMKQSSWEELIKKYPDYVPFTREFNDLEKGGIYAKRGFVNQSNPVKQGIGSQRNTIDSVETIAERISQYVKTAKKNEVGKELVKTVQGNPNSFSGIAEIVTPKNAELNSNALTDINKILETDGIDGIVTKLNNSFDNMFSARKGGAIEKGNNIVTVLDNGSPIYLKINDPDLLKAVSSLDQTTIPKIFQAIGKGVNVMKTLTTGINPAFGLAKNVWKDLVTGYVNSKTINANPLGYAKYVWDMLRAVGNVMGEGTDKAIGSKLPDSLETLLKKASDPMANFLNIGGGGHASNITADRNIFNDSIKSLYKPKLSLKSIPKTLYKGLEGLNNTLEISPRLAEYKRQIKAGSSIDKALFESQDLTTNFSRFGNTSKLIDSFVPYYNAAWQGLDKTVRQFNPANGNGKQVLNSAAKAIYAITIPTIVLYAKNHNDPAYQMLSDYQKDNFFNIPKGDGTFIKLPKPRELGVIFGALPERLLKTFKDNDPNGFKRFVENAWQNFAPPDPFTENITMPAFKTLNTPEGRDWRNKPIVNQGLLSLSPKLQYDESTSEFGKTVGNIVNISPKKIDNLAKSYLGGVAQFGLPALTKGKSMGDVLKSQFTVDPIYSNDILNDFYTRYDKAKTATADNNKLNNIPSKLMTKEDRIVSQYRKIADYINVLQERIKLEKDPAKVKEMKKLILERAKQANY